jgi:hypothetical protein
LTKGGLAVPPHVAEAKKREEKLKEQQEEQKQIDAQRNAAIAGLHTKVAISLNELLMVELVRFRDEKKVIDEDHDQSDDDLVDAAAELAIKSADRIFAKLGMIPVEDKDDKAEDPEPDAK